MKATADAGARRERALGRVIAEAALALAMDVLAGRTNTVALVVALGGGPLAIGAVAAMAPLGALVQVPALWLLHRVGARKPLIIGAGVPGRAMWLLVGLVALLPGELPRLQLVAGLLFLRAALAAVAQCAQNSWMRDLLPMDELGGFYAVRMRVAEVTAIGASLVAAGVLRTFEPRAGASPLQGNVGLAVVFMLAALAGQAGIACLATVPEPPFRQPADPSVRAALAQAFADSRYARYLVAMAAWLLATSLAGPFLVVFEVRTLGLPVWALLVLEALEKGVLLTTLKRWGHLADRHSGTALVTAVTPLHGLVLVLAPLLALIPLSGSSRVVLLAVLPLHVGLGLATGAATLGLNTLALRLAPAEHGASYLAARSLIMNVLSSVGPLAGGAVLALHVAALPMLLVIGAVLVVASGILMQRVPLPRVLRRTVWRELLGGSPR